MGLARLFPLLVVLLIVSCFSAQADEPLPTRPDVRSAVSTEADLDVGALPPKGPPNLESSLWRLVDAQRSAGPAGLSAEAKRSGITLRDGAVRVVIEAKDGQSPSVIASARSVGATLETSYADLVQVLAPVATLERLSNDPSVRYVRQPTRYFPAVVTGEGVGVVNADDWQAAGITGSGVKVAVLDLGFQGYTSLLGTELPASVTAQSFRADGDITGGGEPHGTAVAEIVHEMAPGAQLYLVNFETDPELANAVNWIVGQGGKVINASWGCSVCGPGDGTGSDNALVTNSIAAGVQWAIAAGNEADSHWTGMWSDPDADGWLNFSGTDETSDVVLYAGEAMWLEMKWTDSWPAGCRDYDLYITNSANTILQYSENVQNCSGSPPVEYAGFVAPYNDTFKVWVHKYSATGTPRFHLYWQMFPLYLPWPTLQYVVASRSLGIPADNANAISVGAVPWSGPTTIEPFSSQGPTEDGRIKPDLVAPDYVSGATYGPSGFPGTSAASPHVAGAAALVKQAYPTYTPAQIKSFLEGRAVPLGAAGKDNIYGSGRLDLASFPDADGDGVWDGADNCPNTANANQLDSDGDGKGNVCDNCPAVSNPTQTNSDADTYGDACDNCPAVTNQNQADSDGDGKGNVCDNCPTVSNPTQTNSDADTYGDACDNCPALSNPTQTNSDADTYGDACDNCPSVTNQDQADSDGDGKGNVCDNCPAVSNPTQTNSDGDSYGDACDNCPNDPNNDVDGDGVCGDVDNCPAVSNPGQQDADSDGLGDACDACPNDPDNDVDGDGVCGDVDNCPAVANPGQQDADSDGLGDACDHSDGDGFVDAVELYLGTDPLDNCPDVVGADDAWPLDIDVNCDLSVTGDVINYLGRIGAKSGPSAYCPGPLQGNWLQRLDLNMSCDISVTGDVFLYLHRIGEKCT